MPTKLPRTRVALSANANTKATIAEEMRMRDGRKEGHGLSAEELTQLNKAIAAVAALPIREED